MRKGLILGVIAFGVVLAVVVGNRLSNEAMAVVVGAVCGISAAIPMSIALIIASSQNWGRAESQQTAPQPPRILVVPSQTPPPHTVVISSQEAQHLLVSGGVANPNAPRDFTRERL